MAGKSSGSTYMPRARATRPGSKLGDVPDRRRKPRGRDTGLASMGPMIRNLLEMHGLDAVTIAGRTGVDLAAVPGPNERIEIDKVDALLRVALTGIADPAFGLQAARCWHPANLGVLGHAWLSSSTLRTGLTRLARYWALVGERARLEVKDTPRGLKVLFWGNRGNPATVPVAAVLADIAMAVLLDMCRLNAGAALRPISVSLRRKEPEQAAPYTRFFGCTPQFGMDENALVLTSRDADRRLPTTNKQLAAVFDHLLTSELARLDKDDVVARCQAEVLEHLPSGETSEEDIAKRLHMSPRTLQRKLAEAEITYLQLVENTRRNLALQYIHDQQRSITDITFLLGFSEPSSFARAFKRWTGQSPTDYRARAEAVTA